MTHNMEKERKKTVKVGAVYFSTACCSSQQSDKKGYIECEMTTLRSLVFELTEWSMSGHSLQVNTLPLLLR